MSMIQPRFLTAPNLQHPRLCHGFFMRGGGISQGLQDRGRNDLAVGFHTGLPFAEVLENFRRVEGVFGHPFVTAHQVHGVKVEIVHAPWPAGRGPIADALVTTIPGLGLGVLTADCVPILLADTDQGVVGACHGGWRGLKAGIVESTVAAMVSVGANRSQIQAAIGPCLGPNSYEVQYDFVQNFAKVTSDAAVLFRPGPSSNKRFFNLPMAAKLLLQKEGLNRLFTVEKDTFSNSSLFFSHRRATLTGDRDQGRQISLIALKSPPF